MNKNYKVTDLRSNESYITTIKELKIILEDELISCINTYIGEETLQTDKEMLQSLRDGSLSDEEVVNYLKEFDYEIV